MRSALVAGAAVLTGLIVTPAFAADSPKPYAVPKAVVAAPAPVTGYLELYGATTNDSYWGSTYSPWNGIGGAGRANWWLSPTHSLQLDFQGVAQASTYSSPDYYIYWNTGMFAHLNTRDASRLFGVFGGVNFGNDYDMFYGAWDGVVGAEAQWYHNNVTFYGQVGWQRAIDSYYGYDTSMVFTNLEARWFIHPNTKLAANIGYTSGSLYGSGGGYNVTNYGAEIEQKLGMSPVTAFVRYDGLSFGGNHADTFKGGIRLMIGQPSLIDQDRKGATLKVDLTPTLWLRGVEY